MEDFSGPQNCSPVSMTAVTYPALHRLPSKKWAGLGLCQKFTVLSFVFLSFVFYGSKGQLRTEFSWADGTVYDAMSYSNLRVDFAGGTMDLGFTLTLIGWAEMRLSSQQVFICENSKERCYIKLLVEFLDLLLR